MHEDKRRNPLFSLSLLQVLRRSWPGVLLLLAIPLLALLPRPNLLTGDTTSTDPLEGHREFLIYSLIAQSNSKGYLASQDQTDLNLPFSFQSGGSIGAPLSAFDSNADDTYSHALAWGRDGRGDFVLEARVFHDKGEDKTGAISLVATYVGESSPAYTLKRFDTPSPPAKTDDNRVEQSRCVDMAALDIDGDGIRDFVVVYGSTASGGKLKAVAINGNLTGSGGLAVKEVTGWTSSDGNVHLVPNVRAVAGDFLGDGTPAVAWLAAEQNDTHQPTEKDGSYVLWACSFGRDFFTNGTKTLSSPQILDKGFSKNLTGECDLAAGDLDGDGTDEILPVTAGRVQDDVDGYGVHSYSALSDVYSYRFASGALTKLAHNSDTHRIGGQDAHGTAHDFPMWAPVRCGAGDIDGDGKDELVWVSSGNMKDDNYGCFVFRMVEGSSSSLSYSYNDEYDGNWTGPPMSDGIEFDLTVGPISSAYALPNATNGNLVKRQVILAWRSGDNDNCLALRGITWTGSDFVDGNVKNSFKLDDMSGVKGLYLALGDWNDQSFALGDPVHYTAYGSISPIVVLQEPPKHFDLVDGVSIDAFRSLSGFQSQFQLNNTSSATTATTNVTDWSVGAQTQGSLTWGHLFKWNLTSTLSAAMNGKKTDLDKQVAQQSTTSVAAAENDDQVYFTVQDLDVWRYPILNETATDASGNVGPAWYQIVVPIPGDAPVNASVCGTNLEWYQPVHENGNLLSYPNSIARISDHPSGNTGDLTSAAAFDTGYNEVSQNWTWTNSQFTESGNTLGGNLGASLTFGVASRPKKKGDPNGWNASIGVTGDGAYSHAVTTKSDFSNSTGLKVQKPNTNDAVLAGPIPWNHLVYGVTAQVFQAQKGYLTMGFAPNLTGNGAGDFWTGRDQTYDMPYYEKPDPALNLPRKYVSTPYRDSNGFDRHKWLLSDASASHDIRGIYFTTTAGTPGSVLPDSTTSNLGVDLPKGQSLYVNCRIYNYSFLPVSNVKVRFYYAPYNPQPGQTGEGSPVEIGTVTVPQIPGWTAAGDPNWAWAQVLWNTASLSSVSPTDTYMVRVRIDPEGEIAEIHDDGDPAENNTGRYEVALVDPADLDLSSSAVSGTQKGVGAIQIPSCDIVVPQDSLSVSKTEAAAGDQVLVNASVLLSGTNRKRPLVRVGFYDGDPDRGGKLFDLRRIPLLTPNVPYGVQAVFHPTTSGTHVLYTKVLSEVGNRKSGQTASVSVQVSGGGGGGSGSGGGGGCNAAGLAWWGLLLLLPLLARRRQ